MVGSAVGTRTRRSSLYHQPDTIIALSSCYHTLEHYKAFDGSAFTVAERIRTAKRQRAMSSKDAMAEMREHGGKKKIELVAGYAVAWLLTCVCSLHRAVRDRINVHIDPERVTLGVP